jgi:DNA polymerase-3 subunit beta
MTEITDDEARKAEIAAAAQVDAAEPAEAAAEPEKPKRKRAPKAAAEEAGVVEAVAAEAVAVDAAAAEDNESLYWKGPTAFLRAAFRRVDRAASSKSMPILRCVGMTWARGCLEIRATNLDLHASARVEHTDDVQLDGTGGFAIDAGSLRKLLERAGKQIEIECDGPGKVTVLSDNWHAKVLTLDIEDMPPMPRIHRDGVYLPCRALKKLLKAVFPATSTDSARYVLNGVCLDLQVVGLPPIYVLAAVATDGRRLAMATTNLTLLDTNGPEGPLWDLWYREQGKVLLPNDLVAFLLGSLTGNDGPAGFGIMTVPEPGKEMAKVVGVWFMEEGMQVCSKVLDGKYPDFRQVIPAQVTEPLAIDIDALVEGVGRAEVMAGGKQNSVQLTFLQQEVSVLSCEQGRGEWWEKLPIVAAADDVKTICSMRLNPDYVPPMAGTGQGQLDIGHARTAGPLVWRSWLPLTAGCDAQFTYVLMPMRGEGGAE